MKVKNAIVGAKVMIKKSSSFYLGTPSNPTESVGTIASIKAGWGFPIRVSWEGGYNSYNYEDLKLIKE